MQFHRFNCLATVPPRNKIVMLVICWLNLNIIITGAALGFVFISLFLSIFVELGVQTNKKRQGLGRKLVARLSHIWSDLHLLECLVARISKGVPADQKVKGKDGNKDK